VLAALAASLSLAAMPERAAAQGDGVQGVIRRGDRRALIVLFASTIKDATAPRGTEGIRVVDVRAGRAIPLAPQTVIDPARCPQPAAGPEDRLCIEFAGADRLDDATPYVLYLDRVAREGPGDAFTPGVVPVPPVGGKISLDEGAPGRRVRIDYSLDVSSQSALEPRIQVNGRAAPVTTTPTLGAAGPRCYTRGAMAFICDLDGPITSGQKVTASLWSGGQNVTVGIIEPATPQYDAPASADDARLAAKGAYGRTDGNEQWSVQLRAQNWTWIERGGPATWHTTTFGPVVDITATNDDDDPGSLNFGGQVRSLIFPRGLRILDLRAASRSESDKKTTVTNWMWADATLRAGVPGLYRGRLPGRGYYSVVPLAGIEVGRTAQEDSGVVRPESGRPLRVKAAATAVLAWPKSLLKVPAWLPFEGLRVDAEARQYRLQSLAVGATDRTPDPYRNVQLTYKLSPAVGLTAGWRAGALPPLFVASRVFDLGLSALY
jgi:hypothetical protein